MGAFDSLKRGTGGMECFEPQHRLDGLLDERMILLNNVIEILHLPDLNQVVPLREFQKDIHPP